MNSPSAIRRLVTLQVVGLVVGAAAIATRWVFQDVTSRSLPPGIVILAAAAGLLCVVRRPVSVAIGAAAGGLVLIQLLTNVTSTVVLGGVGVGAAATVWVELVAVAIAVAAGAAALVIADRADRTARGDGSRPHRWGRGLQVAGLLVLAPVCAEYLAAYDDSTGHPAQLIGNLVVFIPLYGCSALLVREVARRAGLGWVGIVLLAAAFGLMQAGVVDQSLFSTDYRQIEGWEEGYQATLVAPLGISVFNALNFVGGHLIFSICAPIGLVEATRPREATRVWLGWPGLAITAVAYLAASALVLHLHLTTEDSHASLVQVLVTLAVIGGLIFTAFRLGRRPRPSRPRPAPRVAAVVVLALALSVVAGFAEETWTGVAMTAGAYLVAALVITTWSRRTGWGVRHIAVLAAAPLFVRAVLAFTYDPLIGEVSESAKYGHNAVMLAVVLLAVGLSLRPRSRVEAAAHQDA